jgi:phosphate transport system protein
MDCLKMIVTQHPTDGHLRTITAILEVATELERITAFASDNVRIPFMAIEQPMLALLVDIQRMALKARDALHRVMQAFVHRDPTAVQTILAEAAGLDALYHEVYQNLLTLIRSSPRTNNSRAVVNQARYLSRVARNLKGAADHVARICRWVASAIPDRMVGARLLPELVPHTA